MPNEQPVPQTWLAFDVGSKKTGVAVGNTLTRKSQPLTIIKTQSRPELISRAQALLGEWQAAGFVVGIASHSDGSAHSTGLMAAKFARQLAHVSHLPYALVDEYLSSQEAKSYTTGSDDDAFAAAIILEQHLASMVGFQR